MIIKYGKIIFILASIFYVASIMITGVHDDIALSIGTLSISVSVLLGWLMFRDSFEPLHA